MSGPSSQTLRNWWAPPCRGPWASVVLNGGGTVSVRPAIVPAVKALNACLVAAGYRTRRADTGAYNCRRITGGSGYSLHAYGTALDLNWQCLHGDTKIVTWDGMRPISKLTDEPCRVLTRDPFKGGAAKWVEVQFSSFGQRSFDRITVSRRGVTREILATSDHRWFVRRNAGQAAPKQRIEEVVGADLKVGQTLAGVLPPPTAFRTNVSSVGVAAGLVYGDGSRESVNRGSHVTLFGPKRELLRFFAEPVTHSRRTPAGVPGIHVSGLPGAWKDRPDLNESNSYLLGWLAGYFAADGSVAESGAALLTAANRDDLDFFRTAALRCGIACNEPSSVMRSGFGQPPAAKWTMTLVARTVPAEFFIRSDQAARQVAHARKPNDTFDWKIVAIERDADEGESFCTTVPATGCFALDGWLLTGNSNPYSSRLRTDMPRAMTSAISAIRTNSGAQVWRWGGDYSGNKDAMHFEIVCTPGDLATGIRSTSTPRTVVNPTVKPAPKPVIPVNGVHSTPPDTNRAGPIHWLQDMLNAIRLKQKLPVISSTGHYSSETIQAVRAFQKFSNEMADMAKSKAARWAVTGSAGPKTVAGLCWWVNVMYPPKK